MDLGPNGSFPTVELPVAETENMDSEEHWPAESTSTLDSREVASKLPQPQHNLHHHHRHHQQQQQHKQHQHDSCHTYRDLLLTSGDHSSHPLAPGLSDRASSISFDISTSSARSSTDSVYGDREDESTFTRGSGEVPETQGEETKNGISASGTPQTVLAQDGAVADLSILQCPFCSRAFLGLYELNEQLEQAKAEAAALRQQLAKLMPNGAVGDAKGELTFPAGGSLSGDDYLSSTRETTMDGTGTIGSAHFFLSEEAPTCFESGFEPPERIGLPRVMDQALAKLAGDVDPLSPEEEDEENIVGVLTSMITTSRELQNEAASTTTTSQEAPTTVSPAHQQPDAKSDEDSVTILCVGDGSIASLPSTSTSPSAAGSSTSTAASSFFSTASSEEGPAGLQLPSHIGGQQGLVWTAGPVQGSLSDYTTAGVPASLNGTLPCTNVIVSEHGGNSSSGYKMVVVATQGQTSMARLPANRLQASVSMSRFPKQAPACVEETGDVENPAGPPPSSSGPGMLVSQQPQQQQQQQQQQQDEETQSKQRPPHPQLHFPPRRVVQLRPAAFPPLQHQQMSRHPHHQPHRPPHCPQVAPPLLVFKEGHPAPGSNPMHMPGATAATAAAPGTTGTSQSRGVAFGPCMVQVATAASPPAVAAPGAA